MNTYLIVGSDGQHHEIEADYFRAYKDNRLGVYRKENPEGSPQEFLGDDEVFFANPNGWSYIKLIQEAETSLFPDPIKPKTIPLDMLPSDEGGLAQKANQT